MEKSVYELTLAARKDARQTAGELRYAWPWVIAAEVSGAIALLVVGAYAGYFFLGAAGALAAVALLLTFPVFVCLWAVGWLRVEWSRLGLQRALLILPEPVLEQAEPEGQAEGELEAERAELVPGYELEGRIVSPTGEATAAAVALRADCLTFVRAGLRRGGWSRSKIAEGPSALMRGEAWDRASRELQRLGYFGKGTRGALEPLREVGDVLKRLEAAK